jgi:tripartite-type tricarboxylate transporter receptor subunit TctC
MLRMRITAILLAFAVAPSAVFAQASPEANWPSRPVRVLAGFPAGGSTDTVARLVAQMLGARLGQNFVVENRAGASGNLATEAVARAAPDGYTLGLATTTTHGSVAGFARSLPFDPVKDFAPVSMLGSSPFVMAVYPELPAKDLRAFIALAKAKPGGLSYGSAGAGSLAHLIAALFEHAAGVSMVHIPYKASAQSTPDLMTGRLDMQFATVPPTLALLRSGKLRALGIASAQRSGLLPDLPTLSESGLPGFDASLWFAIVAPAATAPAIVARLNREIAAVLATDEAKQALAQQGVDAQASTPAALGARIRDEIVKWREVITKAGIQPE